MKAYLVQCDFLDENNATIRFADRNVVARREGANELDVEFQDVTCVRQPGYDEYAPGPVPLSVLVNNGWWQECFGCGLRLECGLGHTHDGDEIEVDMVDHGSWLYCTPACRDRDLEKRDLEKRIEAATVQYLEVELLRRLPGAEILDDAGQFTTHVYVDRGEARQGRISFTFPGSKHKASGFQFNDGGEPDFYVPLGDHDAFQAWAKKQRRAA